MKSYSRNILLVVCVSIALLKADWTFAENGRKAAQVEFDVKLLLSEHQTERNHTVEKITTKYNEVSKALLCALGEADSNFRTNRRAYSPLHSAICAVEAWQVQSANELLLSMVDYELDPKSLPVGINVSGNYFFPAASALVNLRANTENIAHAIGAAETQNKLRILTWILLERVGENEVEQIKMILANAKKRFHKDTANQNFDKAIELLANPSVVLPIPNSGQKSP